MASPMDSDRHFMDFLFALIDVWFINERDKHSDRWNIGSEYAQKLIRGITSFRSTNMSGRIW